MSTFLLAKQWEELGVILRLGSVVRNSRMVRFCRLASCSTSRPETDCPLMVTAATFPSPTSVKNVAVGDARQLALVLAEELPDPHPGRAAAKSTSQPAQEGRADRSRTAWAWRSPACH